jgi:hypothetical protein
MDFKTFLSETIIIGKDRIDMSDIESLKKEIKFYRDISNLARRYARRSEKLLAFARVEALNQRTQEAFKNIASDYGKDR